VSVSVVIPVRSIEGGDDVVRHLGPGASEVVLQAGCGIALARNNGARRSTGDVLLHCDDDVLVVGDLSWFDRAPARHAYWVAARWSTSTDDPYTRRVSAFQNMQVGFGLFSASVGSFQPMRRYAFEAVGGYADTAHDDMRMARALHRLYGPPGIAPFEIVILRRTVTAPENWQRHGARPPPSDGPFRVYRPRVTTSPPGTPPTGTASSRP
jgi:hypothetical protein